MKSMKDWEPSERFTLQGKG